MAKGHPDWQPVAAGVGREQSNVTAAAVPFDLVVNPGAGLRRLMFWFHVSNEAAAGAIIISETTAANVFVRVLWRGDMLADTNYSVAMDGFPLATNNKVRVTAAPAQITVTTIFGTVSA